MVVIAIKRSKNSPSKSAWLILFGVAMNDLQYYSLLSPTLNHVRGGANPR